MEKGDVGIENLDVLEKDFQRVIADLSTEKSLDKFKEEYQALFEALKVSHEKNTQLLEQCRTINTQITSNSSKVNSVLQIAQDDQRTISGLRFEFEKAWKMVEISEEKEQKTRDVISALKEEVAQLTRQADAGASMVLTDETSLDTIETEIRVLKREITMQKEQIDGISADKQRYQNELMEMKDIINRDEQEMDDMNKELEEIRQRIDVLISESDAHHGDVRSLASEVQAEREKSKQIEEEQDRVKRKIVKGKNTMNSTRRTLNEMEAVVKDKKERVGVAKGVLTKRLEHGYKIQDDLDAMNEKISKKQQEIEKIGETTQGIDADIEAKRKELDEWKSNRSTIKSTSISEKDHLNNCRQEIYQLTHNHMRSTAKINAMKHMISEGMQANITTKNEIGNEKFKREAIYNQQEGVQVDILRAKDGIHNQRKKVSQLHEEIDRYKEDLSQVKGDTGIAELDNKMNISQTKELEKSLIDIQDQINKTQTLEEAIIQQRDLSRRQLEDLQQESTKIADDNRYLHEDIEIMKAQIKEADQCCIELHLTKKQIDAYIVPLKQQCENEEESLKAAGKQIATLQNQLVRARYLKDIAESDLTQLQRSVQKMETSFRASERQVHAKDAEVKIMRQKAQTLKWTIEATGGQYEKMLMKVKDLKDELIFEVDKVRKLQGDCQHERAVFLEGLRLEKSLLTAKARVKALEEELETPTNIHRWRFIESTNPEQAQLLKMTLALRSTFMTKLAQEQRAKALLRDTQLLLDKKRQHLRIINEEEHREAVGYYSDLLKAKSAQLKQLEQNVSQFQPEIDQSAETVECVKDQIRETRKMYFEAKQKNDTMRASSELRKTSLPETIDEPRFVGGGFGASTTRRSHSVKRAVAILPGTVLEPVLEKNRKSMSTLLPKGWNVKRAPLQPLLPTVSQLKSTI